MQENISKTGAEGGGFTKISATVPEMLWRKAKSKGVLDGLSIQQTLCAALNVYVGQEEASEPHE